MAFDVSGQSSPGGFELVVFDLETSALLARGETKRHASPSFSVGDEVIDKEIEDTFWHISETVLSVFFLNVLRFRKHGHATTAILGARLFRSFQEVAYEIVEAVVEHSSAPTWGQWHACEHMLAWLYAHDRPRTREELLLAPRVTPHCGTEEIAAKVAMTAKVAAQFLAAQTDSKPRAALLLLAGELIAERGVDQISLLLQRHLTTAEPIKEQIEETLKLAEILDAEIIETREKFEKEAAEAEAEEAKLETKLEMDEQSGDTTAHRQSRRCTTQPS